MRCVSSESSFFVYKCKSTCIMMHDRLRGCTPYEEEEHGAIDELAFQFKQFSLQCGCALVFYGRILLELHRSETIKRIHSTL